MRFLSLIDGGYMIALIMKVFKIISMIKSIAEAREALSKAKGYILRLLGKDKDDKDEDKEEETEQS